MNGNTNYKKNKKNKPQTFPKSLKRPFSLYSSPLLKSLVTHCCDIIIIIFDYYKTFQLILELNILLRFNHLRGK